MPATPVALLLSSAAPTTMVAPVSSMATETLNWSLVPVLGAFRKDVLAQDELDLLQKYTAQALVLDTKLYALTLTPKLLVEFYMPTMYQIPNASYMNFF